MNNDPLLAKEDFYKIYPSAVAVFYDIIRAKVVVHYFRNYIHLSQIGRDEALRDTDATAPDRMRADMLQLFGKKYELSLSDTYSLMTELIEIESRTETLQRELSVYQNLLKIYLKSHQVPDNMKNHETDLMDLINYNG